MSGNSGNGGSSSTRKTPNNTSGSVSAYTTNAYPPSYTTFSQQQQLFAQLKATHPHELQPTSPQQASNGQSRAKFALGDFTISRTLGTGSFGRVHLVQSKRNTKYYAMKVLKKSEVVRLKQVEHTNNEKHILEQVNHPFLVNLWGTFQDSANLYMVMDYVAGGELFSVLRKSQVVILSLSLFF